MYQLANKKGCLLNKHLHVETNSIFIHNNVLIWTKVLLKQYYFGKQ